MPGTYWHNDDFLFEIQFPTTGEESMESRKAADEFLERFLRRLRRTGFTRRPQPKRQQPQPQPGVVGIDITPEIVRVSICLERPSGEGSTPTFWTINPSC